MDDTSGQTCTVCESCFPFDFSGVVQERGSLIAGLSRKTVCSEYPGARQRRRRSDISVHIP